MKDFATGPIIFLALRFLDSLVSLTAEALKNLLIFDILPIFMIRGVKGSIIVELTLIVMLVALVILVTNY